MHITQIAAVTNSHYLISFVRMNHCWGSFLGCFVGFFFNVKVLAWTQLLANFFPHCKIITQQITQK